MDLDRYEIGSVVGEVFLWFVFHAVAYSKVFIETLHCRDFTVFLLLAHGEATWFVGVWVEGDAVKLELLVFGGKAQNKVVFDASGPLVGAIAGGGESEWTCGTVEVDGLGLGVEAVGDDGVRSYGVGDFKRDEEGGGGQRQRGRGYEGRKDHVVCCRVLCVGLLVVV